eukprot:6201623-Pleurochrysis_carterae.AAC.2
MRSIHSRSKRFIASRTTAVRWPPLHGDATRAHGKVHRNALTPFRCYASKSSYIQASTLCHIKALTLLPTHPTTQQRSDVATHPLMYRFPSHAGVHLHTQLHVRAFAQKLKELHELKRVRDQEERERKLAAQHEPAGVTTECSGRRGRGVSGLNGGGGDGGGFDGGGDDGGGGGGIGGGGSGEQAIWLDDDSTDDEGGGADPPGGGDDAGDVDDADDEAANALAEKRVREELRVRQLKASFALDDADDDDVQVVHGSGQQGLNLNGSGGQ